MNLKIFLNLFYSFVFATRSFSAICFLICIMIKLWKSIICTGISNNFWWMDFVELIIFQFLWSESWELKRIYILKQNSFCFGFGFLILRDGTLKEVGRKRPFPIQTSFYLECTFGFVHMYTCNNTCEFLSGFH